MPRLLIEKGPDRGKSLTLKVGDQAVVGRDAQANLQLSDVMCSRRHFLVASKGSVFGLKDLGSANGTQVNTKTADGPVKLQHGDMIQCGETLISWLSDEGDAKQGGLIGQQIGGYRIEARLGRGAMGTVYKAIQLSLGRVVALKVLSPELVKDAKFCEMFLKEARAAGALNHPNIVQVYDVGEENGQYYFSMELAAKGSVLDQLNAAKRIELPRAVVIIKDACRALEYGERKGLVHRDIKPDNLMVMEDETVKLGDLGLAMSAQELQGEQAGVFGTPHYIAPEQAMGKPIDHRADIYALGASFYRILCGQTLFTGQTVKEILKKQVRDAHPPITAHMPECPPAIVTILDKMLAKNAAERYQHAGDVLMDLENWQSLAAKRGKVEASAFARPVKGPSVEMQQQMAAAAQRRNVLLAAVAAIVGVTALSIMVWLFFFSDGAGQIANANNVPANNALLTNMPPSNSGSGPVTTLTPEQEKANSNLREAIGSAKEYAKTPDYTKAIDRLEKAIKDNGPATDGVVNEARKLIAQYKLLQAQEGDTVNAMREEWAETQRAKAIKMEEWKFQAAENIVKAFWEKHIDEAQQEKKEIFEEADNYLRVSYWKDVARQITSLRQWLVKQSEQAGLEQDLEKKLSVYTEAQTKAQTAYDACDHEASRRDIKVGLDQMNDAVAKVKKDQDESARVKFQQSLAETEQAIIDLCGTITEDIRRGDFKSPLTRLDTFEKTHTTYLKYKADARFANCTDMLRLRREQCRHELEALKLLGTGARAVMPSPKNQAPILATKPWPKAALDLFGNKDARIRLEVVENPTESQWKLTVLAGMNNTEMSAGDFAPGRNRDARGLAAALAHLILADETLKQALLLPAGTTKGDPPAIAGLFAWLAELGASSEFFAALETCYALAPKTEPGFGVLREYMAYALKMQARAEFDSNNRTRAEELLKRLNSDEFKGTRVRAGK